MQEVVTSLKHNGVLFQKPFESKGFNEINGIKISLLAEEMLYKFSPYAFNKYNKNELFINNVWTDLKPQLPTELQSLNFPKDFMKVLTKMQLVSNDLKLEKTISNKEHKTEIEKEKSELKEKYGYCYKNGEKTELGNYMCEGSRWFISRGELCGRWVSSVRPEDVEINASEDVPCTVPNHKWKKVELRQTDYVAHYKINIGFGSAFVDKFVWLSANSKDKQEDNEHKYDKARKLLLKIDEIEKTVIKDCSDKNKLKRENALITYIVLTFGIRIGNDHGEDNIRDKNVRGASTLCVENMDLHEVNNIHLKFIGKDSVPYSETMEVNPKVYNEFIKQIKNKKPTDKLYSLATSNTVNEYLKSIYDGEISIKLFRTAKGSGLLAKEMQSRKWKNLTDKEFKNNLMECCLQTSLLLNHHKTVTEEQKEKTNNSVNAKLENAKFSLDKTKETINKKLKKLSDERKDYEKCLSGKILESTLKEVDEKEKTLKEKLKTAEKKYSDIKKQMEFKISTLDVNLGTAINSYSTPLLTMSLCKYAKKEPKLVYSKTQLKKFEWAIDVDKNYWKKYPNTDKE